MRRTLFGLIAGIAIGITLISMSGIGRASDEGSSNALTSWTPDIKQIMNDAMQDGLILFEEYLQSSIDTRIADQLQAGEASDKLLYAAELWRAAADMAALEG